MAFCRRCLPRSTILEEAMARIDSPVKLTVDQMDRLGKVVDEYVIDGFRLRMCNWYHFILTRSGGIYVLEYEFGWRHATACLLNCCKGTFQKGLRWMERRCWFERAYASSKFHVERR